MRYFKYDLWINDAEDEWRENDLKYSEYFNTIKKDFSQDFLDSYYCACGFHDYEIRSMIMSKDNTFVLELYTEQKRVFVEYKNVSKVSFSSHRNKDMSIYGFLEWGYDEFYKEDDGSFTHSILTSCGMEITVVFKEVTASASGCDKPRGTVVYF